MILLRGGNEEREPLKPPNELVRAYEVSYCAIGKFISHCVRHLDILGILHGSEPFFALCQIK